MKYIDINDYDRKWMFTNKDFPVSGSDIHFILPVDVKYAREIWDKYIGVRTGDPLLLGEDEWPSLESTWTVRGNWQEIWNSEDMVLPQGLKENIDWSDEAPVLFMCSRESIIETIWSVFQRNWKCFLLENKVSFLFNPENHEIVQFGPQDGFQIGKRK